MSCPSVESRDLTLPGTAVHDTAVLQGLNVPMPPHRRSPYVIRTTVIPNSSGNFLRLARAGAWHRRALPGPAFSTIQHYNTPASSACPLLWYEICDNTRGTPVTRDQHTLVLGSQEKGIVILHGLG